MTKLIDAEAVVSTNTCVGPNLYVMRLTCSDLPAQLEPGQFVHMQIPGMEGHILRRPFSVYDVDTASSTLDILYQVVGFGSDRMTGLTSGDRVSLIGPIGHGWQVPADAQRMLVVAGGVGAAPLFMFVDQLKRSGVEVDVVLGAQTQDALVTRERYIQQLGVTPVCATDDGSFGHAGFCTTPAADLLAQYTYTGVACCGPEPLMKIVAGMAAEADVPCQISLEKRMACGVGACLSCVVNTIDGKQRACVDGPVFDAEKVVW